MDVYGASTDLIDFELTSNANNRREIITSFKDVIATDPFTLHFRKKLLLNESPTRLSILPLIYAKKNELNNSYFSVSIFLPEDYSVLKVNPQQGYERKDSTIYLRDEFVYTKFLRYTETYTSKAEITYINKFDCDSDEVCNPNCKPEEDPDCVTESSTTTSATESIGEGVNSLVYILGFVIVLVAGFLIYRRYMGKREMEDNQRKRDELISWIEKQLRDGEDPKKLKTVVRSQGFEEELVDYVEHKL